MSSDKKQCDSSLNSHIWLMLTCFLFKIWHKLMLAWRNVGLQFVPGCMNVYIKNKFCEKHKKFTSKWYNTSRLDSHISSLMHAKIKSVFFFSCFRCFFKIQSAKRLWQLICDSRHFTVNIAVKSKCGCEMAPNNSKHKCACPDLGQTCWLTCRSV